MARFLLVAWAGPERELDFLIPPFILGSLAGSLEHARHGVDVLDLNLPSQEWTELLRLLSRGRYDAVVFGVPHKGASASAVLAREVKKVWPDQILLAAGPGVSMLDPEDVLAGPSKAFDCLIVNEPERTLLTLAQLIDKPRLFDRVPNIITLRDGRVFRTEIEQGGSLDAIPPPAWHRLELRSYFPILPVELGRGISSEMQKLEGVRDNARVERTPSAIVDEMRENHRRYGVRHFEIIDGYPTARQLNILCSEIWKSTGHDEHRPVWTVTAGPSLMVGELPAKMRKAGCCAVTLALESCDDGMLLRMSKRIRASMNRSAVLNARAAGLRVVSYNLIGYPGETVESFVRTLTFNIETRPDAIIFHPLEITPDGSPLRAIRECNLISCARMPHTVVENATGGAVTTIGRSVCRNTQSLEEFEAILERAAPVFYSKGLAPQMGSRAYLLSSLLPEGDSVGGLKVPEGCEPYEARLVRAMQLALERGDVRFSPIIERAWHRRREAIAVS